MAALDSGRELLGYGNPDLRSAFNILEAILLKAPRSKRARHAVALFQDLGCIIDRNVYGLPPALRQLGILAARACTFNLRGYLTVQDGEYNFTIRA